MIRRDAMQPTLARMMLVSLVVFYAFGGLAASAQPAPSPVVHHDLAVTVDPATHRLKVRDRIRVPGALVTVPFTFSLNADLNVQALPGGLKLVPIARPGQGSDPGANRDDHDPGSRIPLKVYGVEGATPGQELTGELAYEGVIDYTVKQPGAEYARAFSQSPGLI